jgi:hypothetical protein
LRPDEAAVRDDERARVIDAARSVTRRLEESGSSGGLMNHQPASSVAQTPRTKPFKNVEIRMDFAVARTSLAVAGPFSRSSMALRPQVGGFDLVVGSTSRGRDPDKIMETLAEGRPLCVGQTIEVFVGIGRIRDAPAWSGSVCDLAQQIEKRVVVGADLVFVERGKSLRSEDRQQHG